MAEEVRKLDEIDVKIIHYLQNNARITASEIAQSISMSVPAVSERIKQLEQCGIISGYSVLLNPQKLGRETTAITFAILEKPSYAKAFSEMIKNEPEVLESHYITGNFDYILKIVTKNTSTLEQLLNRIKSVAGVQKTNTYIVLSTEKNTLSIPF